MTPIELATEMIRNMFLDAAIEISEIDERDVASLATELLPAMSCNWNKATIETFVCGDVVEQQVMADIIPNGEKINIVLDTIFEKASSS